MLPAVDLPLVRLPLATTRREAVPPLTLRQWNRLPRADHLPRLRGGPRRDSPDRDPLTRITTWHALSPSAQLSARAPLVTATSLDRVPDPARCDPMTLDPSSGITQSTTATCRIRAGWEKSKIAHPGTVPAVVAGTRTQEEHHADAGGRISGVEKLGRGCSCLRGADAVDGRGHHLRELLHLLHLHPRPAPDQGHGFGDFQEWAR